MPGASSPLKYAAHPWILESRFFFSSQLTFHFEYERLLASPAHSPPKLALYSLTESPLSISR